MCRFSGRLVLPLVLALAAAPGAETASAQEVCYYPPPRVSYYAAPAVAYTYAPPAVAYSYAPPAVAYYPATAYAAPAASVTTYRYGLLPRRRVTVTSYYDAPVVVTPRAPRVVQYYEPAVIVP